MKNTLFKHTSTTQRSVALSAAVFALVNAPAHGQMLEEVIVTAQKRVESLQDVPISVSAVSGERISQMGIQRSEDLTAYVPNFQVTQDPIGDKINIRGIQSGNQAGFEQSVATFMDGVYRGRGVQQRYSFLDVAMVEVLRGPQPTLFGKNTIAGAVNVRSAKPTEEFEGELAAAYNTEFDETELQGYVSGPLSESLRGRLVILDRTMEEGWVENRAYDEDVPATDELFGRIGLEWDAGENTLVTLRYEIGDWTVDGQPWVLQAAGPLEPFLAQANIPVGAVFETWMGQNGFGPFPADPVLDFRSVALFDGDSSEAAVTVEHALSNGSTLTAIVSHSEYEYERFVDADFNPLPVARFDDTEDFEQNSFELRLTSDVGGTLEYIAGLYYQDNDMFVDGLTQFNLGTIGGLLGGGCAAGGAAGAISVGDPAGTAAQVAATVPGSTAALANSCAQAALTQFLVPAGVQGASRYAFLDQETETWAIFAQPTWNISDTSRLTVGLRYTEEQKKATQGAFATDYVARTSTPIADPAPSNPAALASYLIGEFTPHTFTDSDPGMTRDEESFTWSVNFQQDLGDQTMVYASASTGFKAGGFNSFYMGLSQAQGADSNDVGFEEEEVLSFEVGAKIGLLDGAAELNIAAFRTEYDDLQVSVFSGNTTFVVQNAAEATSQGIEIDGRWQATDELMLQGSVGYVNFEYDSFPNQACIAEQFLSFRETAYQTALVAGDIPGTVAASLGINNQTCSAAGTNDLADETSENTPELSAALIANYTKAIGENYELMVSADANFADELFRQGDLDPISKEDSVWKFNAMVSFGAVDGKWDIGVIAKNLSDEKTFTYSNDTPLFPGARQGRIDAPRSFVVRGRYRF